MTLRINRRLVQELREEVERTRDHIAFLARSGDRLLGDLHHDRTELVFALSTDAGLALKDAIRILRSVELGEADILEAGRVRDGTVSSHGFAASHVTKTKES